MMVHLLDGTYELFRHYHSRRRFDPDQKSPFGAVTGVLETLASNGLCPLNPDQVASLIESLI